MIKFAPNKTILKIVSYHNQMDYGLLYLACFMKILRWSKYRCDTVKLSARLLIEQLS